MVPFFPNGPRHSGDQFVPSFSGLIRKGSVHSGSMGRKGIFTDPWMVDFYGKCTWVDFPMPYSTQKNGSLDVEEPLRIST